MKQLNEEMAFILIFHGNITRDQRSQNNMLIAFDIKLDKLHLTKNDLEQQLITINKDIEYGLMFKVEKIASVYIKNLTILYKNLYNFY